MFIVRDAYGKPARVDEAGDELKTSCEVHGGSLFVQLHFKAMQDVPKYAYVINTVVTSNDEKSASFAGCGKHLIAVRSSDEEVPMTKDAAFKSIKDYLGVMFGEDVGNSLKEEDVVPIDANGSQMDKEQLQKWEEQQKKGGEGENAAEKGDGASLAESIPSFGRFIAEDDEKLDDDVGDDDFGDGEEGEEAGDGKEGEKAGDGKEGEKGGDGEEDEEAGDGEEDEEAGDEVPPPATYVVCYLIKADGQPEKDHTDPKDVQKLDPSGKLRLPGIDFNMGIEFLRGGSAVDTLDLKKLGKELKGDVDSDELETKLRAIMRANFPTIDIPSIDIRDSKTIGKELDRRTGGKTPEIDPEEYTNELKMALAKSPYNLWIEVKDYREKPFVKKSDIADVVNAAVKKMGGVLLKWMSGIKQDDVFLLHGLSSLGKAAKAKDEARRKIPNPGEIKTALEKSRTSAEKWSKIDQMFDKCRKQNMDAGEPSAAEAIRMWQKFKSDRAEKPDDVSIEQYDEFYQKYQKFYKDSVAPLLNEEFMSEQGLMQEIFGILYEDDEKPDGDSGDAGGGDSSDKDTEEDDDSSDGGSPDGGSPDGGSSDSGSPDDDDKEDQTVNIFIVPMKHLDVDMDKHRY